MTTRQPVTQTVGAHTNGYTKKDMQKACPFLLSLSNNKKIEYKTIATTRTLKRVVADCFKSAG